MRRKDRGGGGGKRRHPDYGAHADDLQKDVAAQLKARTLERPFQLDPRAILVVTLNRPVSDDVWGGVDVIELDGRQLESTIAFSTRVDLSAFLERLGTYRAATPSEKGYLVGADLFDRVESVRFYGPEDRVTPRLAAHLESTAEDAEVDIDIEIWHPGGADYAEDARAWTDLLRGAVDKADGQVLDWYTNHDIGLLLLRVRVAASQVAELAKLDEIAVIDLKPVAPAVITDVLSITAAALPPITSPGPDAPLFAVIDSGVSGAHPLIGPALYEATTLVPGLADGADELGHGTAVAGVALHGRAEDWLQAGALSPFARLLSIRVLDANNEFPEEQLWANTVAEAVEHAAQRGCRVINLSIGDRDGAMTDRRATRVAALLDDLARRHQLVVVVPTGNVEDLRVYIQEGLAAREEYVRASLSSAETTLLDPAPAALALTVGGLGADGALPLGEFAVGGEASPSALTRRGPGVARAIKPELTAPAGTFATSDLGFRNRRQLDLVVLSHQPDQLFAHTRGTSFAAPLASRIATAVQAQYPDMSSPLVRALVLQASNLPEYDVSLFPDGTEGERLKQRLALLGHGMPSLDGARYSSKTRVVLVAEGTLPVDKILIYEVPLPESFFETGGTRTVDLAVCFDPLTRYRRKDYLGSRLFPYLFLGQTVEAITAVLAEVDEDELTEEDADDIDGDGDAQADEDEGAPKPKRSLKSLNPITFRPSSAASSDSANIFMRARRSQRLDPALPRVAHLAIRSTNRWAPPGTEDAFGVALALGHDRLDVDLHAELKAVIEQMVELEIELDA